MLPPKPSTLNPNLQNAIPTTDFQTFVRALALLRPWVDTHTYIHKYECTYAFMDAYMYAYMYVCVHTHTHTHRAL